VASVSFEIGGLETVVRVLVLTHACRPHRRPAFGAFKAHNCVTTKLAPLRNML
jgi:hypothetical protein